MNAKQTRPHEMLVRVCDFADTYRDVFPASTVAPEVFAAIGAAVDELAETNVQKMSASNSARADRKAAARNRVTEMLIKVNRLGKILRKSGRTTPPFELASSRRDQTLLTVARQFARDATALEADFTGHGMSPAHMTRVADAFEEATSGRWTGRADYTAARARIQPLLSDALLNVCRLDLIIGNELGRDHVIQAVWRQARRIARRGSRTASVEEPAASGLTLAFDAAAAPEDTAA